MFESLADYGIAGIFILYLIWDRVVMLSKLEKAINRLSDVMEIRISEVKE